jgi:type II secretory pathway pseudopilin PulG
MTLLRFLRKRGFTLVELMVALVGGLMVALAVVALSKQATNTVFEEARAASAEMSLRVGVDRLRADIARASFMSTPNVRLDPQIFEPQSSTEPWGTAIAIDVDWGTTTIAGIALGGAAAPGGLRKLAGLRLFADAPLALSTANGLAPDRLRIGGNMTTVEEFMIADGGISPSGTGSCSPAGSRIYLSDSSPAVYRITALGVGRAAALAALFIPVTGEKFMARVTDLKQNKYGLHVVCGAGFDGGTPDRAYVDIEATPPILPQGDGGPDPSNGNATINPVQLVDWYIGPRHASCATCDLTSFGDAGDANRYDLYRHWVNAAGAQVGNPELVAEYAVDLKVAFTVDPRAASGTGPGVTLTTFNFGAAGNATAAADVEPGVSWPQRIRAVRVRLATRAQQPDRSVNLPSPDDASGFLYRYCLDPPTCIQYARVRTVTTDVSVPNQAQAYYPTPNNPPQ